MQGSGGGGGYAVTETVSFEDDWLRGLAEGWINPMVDPPVLETIKDTLARRPNLNNRIPNSPDSLRLIRFPRSARSERGRLEIEYEIVEDDLQVWLLSIRSID